MTFSKVIAALAAVMLMLGQMAPQTAQAAEDYAPVLGTWVDKLPDGTLMVLTFAPTLVSFQPFDATGKGGAPTAMPANYKKQSNGDIQLTPKDPALGEPMRVTLKNATTMEIQFTGRDPRTLTKQQDKPQQHP